MAAFQSAAVMDTEVRFSWETRRAPDGVGLSEADGPYDGQPESRVQGWGHQQVLVPEEVAEPCLQIGVAPATLKQSIGEAFGVCLIPSSH